MTGRELLRGYDSRLAAAWDRLFDGAGGSGRLPEDERALILLGLSAACGFEEDVERHGRGAIEAGAPAEAALEIVLTASLSRGPRVLAAARRFLSGLALQRARPARELEGPQATEYFEAELGSVPDWVQKLAEHSAGALTGYATLRASVLTDGAARRQTKELLVMVLNAVAGNSGGIRSHARAAVQHGARDDELLEALLLGVRVGGIIPWIVGTAALHELLARESAG